MTGVGAFVCIFVVTDGAGGGTNAELKSFVFVRAAGPPACASSAVGAAKTPREVDVGYVGEGCFVGGRFEAGGAGGKPVAAAVVSAIVFTYGVATVDFPPYSFIAAPRAATVAA